MPKNSTLPSKQGVTEKSQNKGKILAQCLGQSSSRPGAGFSKVYCYLT